MPEEKKSPPNSDCSGPSATNFVCHCTVCRAASGRPSLPAAAFKPNQIVWKNEENIDKRLPPNSKNARFYCKSCGDYIAEDATKFMGCFGLPLHLVDNVHDSYKPNHHIFYANRVEDVSDSIPKWETLPDGPIVPSPAPTHESFEVQGNYQPDTGRIRKDVSPIGPTRAPDPAEYRFIEQDPPVNHMTNLTREKVLFHNFLFLLLFLSYPVP